MSIWITTGRYLDFGQIVEQFRFSSKFMKISILVKIVEKFQIWTNLTKKLSNLVKIFKKWRFRSKSSEIIDFSQNLRKCWFCRKLKKMFIITIFEKCRFGSQFANILVLVKLSNNFDYGQRLWKSRFWSKFIKISVFVENVGKPWSWSTFSENLDFSQYLR